MFNCGILAIELPKEEIAALFNMTGNITLKVDITKREMVAVSNSPEQSDLAFSFVLNLFDRDLVSAGGWLAFADKNY